jgi:hypothetical protein
MKKKYNFCCQTGGVPVLKAAKGLTELGGGGGSGLGVGI